MRLRTTAFAIALTTSLACLGSDAHAQQPFDKKVCIAAAERGQELRDGKKMRDARAQFLLCSKKECPAAVASECSRWAAEAEAALATIKLDAVDGAGAKLPNVKVSIDGAPWSDEVPAEPVFVDPGSHEIRFERAGGNDSVVRTVSLAMGERDRVVQAVFKDVPSRPAPAEGALADPKETKETPKEPAKGEGGGGLALPLALGGVGVVAIGTATAFWLMGNSDLDAARERCANGCADPNADDAKQKHLIGDVALGVGIVAIAAAAYFIITREKAPQPVVRF